MSWDLERKEKEIVESQLQERRRGREMQRRPEHSFHFSIASLLSSSLLLRARVEEDRDGWRWKGQESIRLLISSTSFLFHQQSFLHLFLCKRLLVLEDERDGNVEPTNGLSFKSRSSVPSQITFPSCLHLGLITKKRTNLQPQKREVKTRNLSARSVKERWWKRILADERF